MAAFEQACPWSSLPGRHRDSAVQLSVRLGSSIEGLPLSVRALACRGRWSPVWEACTARHRGSCRAGSRQAKFLQPARPVLHAHGDAVVGLDEVPLLKLIEDLQGFDATAIPRLQAPAFADDRARPVGSLQFPECQTGASPSPCSPATLRWSGIPWNPHLYMASMGAASARSHPACLSRAACSSTSRQMPSSGHPRRLRFSSICLPNASSGRTWCG